PSSRTARVTCSRVAGRTLALPLITRHPVIGELSAAAATSWMVTARPLRGADSLVVADSFSSVGMRRACSLPLPLRPHAVCGPAKPRCNEVISIARTAPPRHPAASRGLPALLLMLLAWTFALPALVEDGYDLWLRYKPLPEAQARQYRELGAELVAPVQTPT